MKRLVLVMMATALVGSLSQAAAAQEPVLDLAITDVQVTCLPGEYLVQAEVQLATTSEITFLSTVVEFSADGAPVGSEPYEASATMSSPCFYSTYPYCVSTCVPATINGMTVDGICAGFTFLTPPSCGCIYLAIVTHLMTEWGDSPSEIGVCIDPATSVPEWDEFNNCMTVVVGPSSVEHNTWTAIKVIYR